jgi:hypothetical protein
MVINKVLWLEDDYEDFGAYTSSLFRAGYMVDMVISVSEAVTKLRSENYCVVIIDIKVLPGDDKEWTDLDKKIQRKNSGIDSHLGLELLHALFDPDYTNIKLDPPFKIDPQKIIILTVVPDKEREISSLGIPSQQILYKSSSDTKTLLQMVKDIHNRNEERSDR